MAQYNGARVVTGYSIPMDSFSKSTVEHAPVHIKEDIEQHFRMFVEKMSGRALVMMESATSHHDVARDIVQESFIALHQSYSKRPVDEWTPLFYTILNNRLMDWRRQEIRKQKRFAWLKPVVLDQEENELDPSLLVEDTYNIDPSEFLNRTHTVEEIQKAIARLPVRQQQAFLLRAWENLDTRTTAQIMECSEGSVKTHYHRAIQTLRANLSQFDPEQ